MANKIVFRLHGGNDSFSLTGCGKRSVLALEDEKFASNCFKYNQNGSLEFIDNDYTYSYQKESSKEKCKKVQ